MQGISEELDKKWIEIKENLLRLNDLKIKFGEDTYSINYLNWVKEEVDKNLYLFESKYNEKKKDQELYRKERGQVYWINFGINIGSEFQGYHYAVVLNEGKYTAIVVPLSSEKDEVQKWKEVDDLIIPIGEITGFEQTKPCFAMINQIQVVSKKRLDRVGNKPNYKTIKLSTTQMDMLDETIKNNLVNKKSKDSQIEEKSIEENDKNSEIEEKPSGSTEKI